MVLQSDTLAAAAGPSAPDAGAMALNAVAAGQHPRIDGIARSKRGRRRIIIAALVLCDLALILSIIAVVGFGYLPIDRAFEQVPKFSAILVSLYVLAAINNAAFQVKADEVRIVAVWKAVTAFAASSAGVLLVVFMAKAGEDFSRVVLAGSTAAVLVMLVVERNLLDRWAHSFIGRQAYATLSIYDDVPLPDEPDQSGIDMQRLEVKADASNPEVIVWLANLTHDFDRLVIHCRPEDRRRWAFILKSLSVPAEITVPEIHELNPLSIHRRGDKTSLMIATGPLKWHQRVVKRTFDLALTLAVLPIALPVMGLVAIAIKLDSPGPVFFRQKRIGLNNRPFRIFKFRSMRNEQLDRDGRRLTDRHDPRVTRVGAFIRRTSLDELPQVINVLLGDMSIVGPRPHVWHARAGEALYWEVDSAYWHRHVVQPGITGLAQVRGHRGNTFKAEHLQQRLNSDLEYLADWSLVRDIKIIMGTFRALRHENAF